MTDRIEALITEAAEAYFQGLERDGYRPEGCSGSEATAVILEALKAARIAVVELPRGNADWRSVDWQPVTGWDLAAQRGQIHIDEASNEPLSPHEARALAAALLAAADAAEASQ